MNRTHLEHTIIALVAQFALWSVFGPWGAGAVAIAPLVGREIAQHEYKLALARGWEWGQKKPVRWFEGLIKGWSIDSVLDVAIPALVCGVVAIIGGICL